MTPSDDGTIRILVVDDDEVDRLRIGRMLERGAGRFELIEAVDCRSGFEAVEQECPDCVMLDLRLPDGEGEWWLSQLVQRFPEPPPVIVQTSLNDEVVALSLIGQGAQDYLIKGEIDERLLVRAINYAIRRHALQVEKEHLLAQLQSAMEQIKTLHGLLPMCAGCKKIRKEDGTWEDVETYVEHHSDAEVTHGLCPSCMEAFYPGLTEKRE